jgi:hypothetical protein
MPPVEVSIVIPTQRRARGLEVAARSVFAQAGGDFAAMELVIVDNDQAPSAQALAAALAREAPLPVIYAHEGRPGVATARNAGLAAARGAFIAFLDDDEEAPEGWLAALMAAQKRYDADVVFGPVRARAPNAPSGLRDYFERFFSRQGPAASGVIGHYFGCGDRLVRNHTGGEDDLLFGEMKRGGKRFAWASEAYVWEDPAPDRLTLAYTIPRAFAYGQGPPSACAIREPPDRLGVARWMVIGAMQSLVFGPVALLAWLARRPRRAEALDRAARGLGKVLWWGPFKIHFYGRAAAPPADGPTAPALAIG